MAIFLTDTSRVIVQGMTPILAGLVLGLVNSSGRELHLLGRLGLRGLIRYQRP